MVNVDFQAKLPDYIFRWLEIVPHGRPKIRSSDNYWRGLGPAVGGDTTNKKVLKYTFHILYTHCLEL